MRIFRILLLLISALLSGSTVSAQLSNVLDHLRIGFGGGANSAHIINLDSYNVFEDLSGEGYENSYSGILQNIGNQYFVQLEWYNDYLVAAIKPGTYSFRFSKINEVNFTGETIRQETPYLLRYLSIPVELRYNIDVQRFRPYAGLSFAYSHLLGSNDASNQSFIRPKLSAGAVVGSYIDLRYIILDFNVGYMSSLHNIASKENRFGSGSGVTFAQSDMLLNQIQVSLSLLFSLQKQRSFSNMECYY